MPVVRIAPPNSLVLIGDPVDDVPVSLSGRLVVATKSTVVVGTLADGDGETTIRFGDTACDHAITPLLAFDGWLSLPSRRLTVETAMRHKLGELPFSLDRAHITIWVNDDSEPDQICVLASEPERNAS